MTQFRNGATAPSGPFKALCSYSDTPQTVGLLWTSDQYNAKTSIKVFLLLQEYKPLI